MRSRKRSDEPDILCLPEDIFDDIGSWLEDQNLCQMELASKALHNIMSAPRHPGPCKRRVDIGAHRVTCKPLNQEASRQAHSACKLFRRLFYTRGCGVSFSHTFCTYWMPCKLCQMPGRWRLKRIRRYSDIFCDISNTHLPQGKYLPNKEGASRVVSPPLLSLPADCASKLSLRVSQRQGQASWIQCLVICSLKSFCSCACMN